MTGEFRFQCPACGQHIQAESRDTGTQVKCPTCQADIIVPDAAAVPKLTVAKGRFSVPVPLHAHAAPRAAGLSPPPPPPPPPMCRLAVASLVLSLSSVILWPFGFIPGIIYARKAQEQLKRNPALGGRKVAQVALVVGYGFAAIFGVAVLVLATLYFNASRNTQPSVIAVKQAKLPPPAQTEEPIPPKKAEPEEPAIGWTSNLTNMNIPAQTVGGKVRGIDFKFDHASVGTNILVIRESTNTTSDLTVVIAFNQKSGESLSGKKFTISPGQEPPLRWVTVGWWDEHDIRQAERFTNGYALKLELGKVADGKMAGAIYLCLPDTNQSYLAGTFDASIMRPRPAGVTPGTKAPIKIRKIRKRS